MKRVYYKNDFTASIMAEHETIDIVITGLGQGTMIFTIPHEKMCSIIDENICDCENGNVYLDSYMDEEDGKIVITTRVVSLIDYFNSYIDKESLHTICYVLLSDMLDAFTINY